MNKFFFDPKYRIKSTCFILVLFTLFFFNPTYGQKKVHPKTKAAKSSGKRVIYGLCSFYADKFNGRRTASGEIFRQSKLTCACNMLPFGTWIKVTNTHNGKSVVVKVNDRLHARMRRIADLSKSAAKKIGSTASGLVRVKVEVIGKRNPS